MEQKSSDLLQAAKSVLQDPGSSHELKLEAVGWLVERLLQLVPVFEVEDAILAPVLEVVREFLEEVEQLVGRTEAGAREKLVSLTISLLGHSHSLVKHVQEQEGCGLGEVPSLPRLIPPILASSLRCVRKMSTQAGDKDNFKAVINHAYKTTKDLMASFLSVIEKIKIRTVLEDELDILVELCRDLMGLHNTLVSLDFRLSCSVWRVYLHLTSSHHARLADRLHLGAAVELLSAEVVLCLERFREQFGKEAEERPGGVAKMVTMLKLILAMGSAYPYHAVPPSLPHLALNLFSL